MHLSICSFDSIVVVDVVFHFTSRISIEIKLNFEYFDLINLNFFSLTCSTWSEQAGQPAKVYEVMHLLQPTAVQLQFDAVM